MKKALFYRWMYYMSGLLILALGISLNTKSGLGVSPIISVSYSISTIWELNFGNTTLLLYGIFVAAQLFLHLIRNRRYSRKGGPVLAHANRVNMKLILLMDILQLPLSLVFTRFLNLFSDIIPNFETAYAGRFPGSFAGRILILLAAIVLTGVGAAMSLNMRIIPNPGDGIVQAIADCARKEVGFTKNCFDGFNILVTVSLSLLFTGHLIGIGLGTVIAVFGVGRVIAVFNRLFMKKMAEKAGMTDCGGDA